MRKRTLPFRAVVSAPPQSLRYGTLPPRVVDAVFAREQDLGDGHDLIALGEQIGRYYLVPKW